MQNVTPGCFGPGTSNSTFSCGSYCWGGSGCLDFFLRRDSGYNSGLTPHVYDVIGTDLGSSFILCLNDAIPMNLQTFVSSYFSPYGGGPDGGSSDSFIIDEFSPYGGGGFSSNETHSDTFRPQGGGLRLDNLGDEEVLDTSADNSFVTPRPTSAWDAANDDLFSDYPFFSPQGGNSYVHVVPPRPTRVWNDDSPQDGFVYFDEPAETEAVSSAICYGNFSDDLGPYGGSDSLVHVVPPRPTQAGVATHIQGDFIADDCSEGQALWCPSIHEYPLCHDGLIDPVT